MRYVSTNMGEIPVNSPSTAYLYCYQNNNRFGDLEDIISKSASNSYRYALKVIKGRFYKGESIIVDDPYWAYYYSINILKRRWTEAEGLIVKFDVLWKNYCSFFKLDYSKINWKKEGF